jgi:hypothetical protein
LFIHNLNLRHSSVVAQIAAKTETGVRQSAAKTEHALYGAGPANIAGVKALDSYGHCSTVNVVVESHPETRV